MAGRRSEKLCCLLLLLLLLHTCHGLRLQSCFRPAAASCCAGALCRKPRQQRRNAWLCGGHHAQHDRRHQLALAPGHLRACLRQRRRSRDETTGIPREGAGGPQARASGSPISGAAHLGTPGSTPLSSTPRRSPSTPRPACCQAPPATAPAGPLPPLGPGPWHLAIAASPLGPGHLALGTWPWAFLLTSGSAASSASRAAASARSGCSNSCRSRMAGIMSWERKRR